LRKPRRETRLLAGITTGNTLGNRIVLHR
jgi:hypothetical protein